VGDLHGGDAAAEGAWTGEVRGESKVAGGPLALTWAQEETLLNATRTQATLLSTTRSN